jgi:hypothetical protein
MGDSIRPTPTPESSPAPSRQPTRGGEIQAWIGLPLAHPFLLGQTGYVDLADPAIRGAIVAFCAEIVRSGGFAGVHLDPEPVPDGDPELVRLLDEIRAELGPQRRLSLAAPRVQRVLPETSLPWLRRNMWRPAYLREVARRLDQVALMSYDSSQPLPPLFRLWQRHQVIAASQALDGLGVELLIGVPTSEERTLSHWPNAETMEAGLRGVVDGLNDAQARPHAVTGVAIYPEWETDDAEWATYEALWLGWDPRGVP